MVHYSVSPIIRRWRKIRKEGKEEDKTFTYIRPERKVQVKSMKFSDRKN